MIHFLCLCPTSYTFQHLPKYQHESKYSVHESLKHFLSKGQRWVEPNPLQGFWSSPLLSASPSPSPLRALSWNPTSSLPWYWSYCFLHWKTDCLCPPPESHLPPSCEGRWSLHLPGDILLPVGYGRGEALCLNEQAQTQSSVPMRKKWGLSGVPGQLKKKKKVV